MDDQEEDWDEEDDEGAESWDDDEPTVPCPYCGEEIHEDAQRCPACGEYISEEDAPPARKPLWIVAGVLVCLGLILLWITGG